jgi:NitT/TauT family transport system substrate-binding protein
LAGPAAQTDALISGSVDLVGTAAVPLITLWQKTQNTAQEIKGLCALGTIPLYLNTRNPNIQTIRDFKDSDRIGTTAVKLSQQAMLIQMAIAKEFGFSNYSKLDHITVTLAGTDAVAAMSSPSHEVNSSFNGGPPWIYAELDIPGVHRVATMSEILGTVGTTTVIVTTTKFQKANPNLTSAIFSAAKEALNTIQNNPNRAVDAYFEVTGDKKTPRAYIERFLADPETDWSIKPKAMDKFYDFMYKSGTIKKLPTSPADLFFANADLWN